MRPTFFCLCMSPAIDALVKLPAAPRGEGEIFKDVADVENAGGKAINVARWLAIRGAQVACGGLLGEDNAVPFEKALKEHGIEDRFLRVAGSTRRNEMIVWPGGAFKVNRAAFPGLDHREVLGKLEALVETTIGSETTVVLSGSLPMGWPADTYRRLVAAAKARGAVVVLDASGEALRLGCEAQPDVVKPNAEECRPLVGFVPETADDFRRATALLKKQVAFPIISDGGKGCWFDGEFVAAPKVEVVDTTAAGDTLLAEYCWRTFGELGEPRSVAASRDMEQHSAWWAVAAGSAACTMAGSAPPPPQLVERLKDQIGDAQRLAGALR